MKETLLEKEKRLLDAQNPDQKYAALNFLKDKLQREVDKKAHQYLGIVPSRMAENFDSQAVFEGIKPFLEEQDALKEKLAEGLKGAQKFAMDNKQNIQAA